MGTGWKRRFLAALCVAVCLVQAPGWPLAVQAEDEDYQEQINDLNDQYDQLEKEQQKIQQEIDKAKTEKDKKLAEKKQIDTQISNTQQQIALLTDKIGTLNQNIADKEEEIERKQQQIDEHYELFKQRICAMYTANRSTELGLLLGADSFSQFLTRAEVSTAIAEHDRELIETMIRDRTDIELAKAEIEDNVTQVQSAQSALDDKRVQLNAQLQVTEAQVQDIAKLEEEYLANQAQIEAQMREVQAEIDRIYQANQSEGEYTGGIMQWPVPGHATVSSDFGWRFNNTDYHTGIDIAGVGTDGKGIYGKPIVAAADGKVIFVQRSYTPGRGYGIYLIIDHGGGISTLYGHTSDVFVNVGETVTRGQTVAQVGSTGWSTGPHLHFEVRVDGQYVNPWPYLR